MWGIGLIAIRSVIVLPMFYFEYHEIKSKGSLNTLFA